MSRRTAFSSDVTTSQLRCLGIPCERIRRIVRGVPCVSRLLYTVHANSGLLRDQMVRDHGTIMRNERLPITSLRKDHQAAHADRTHAVPSTSSAARSIGWSGGEAPAPLTSTAFRHRSAPRARSHDSSNNNSGSHLKMQHKLHATLPMLFCGRRRPCDFARSSRDDCVLGDTTGVASLVNACYRATFFPLFF